MIAETIFGVAKDLFGILTKLDDKRVARTAHVVDFFSSLAQTIEETSACLKKGDYPHGRCEQLRFHAEHMADAIKDLIGEDQANEYANKILEVWEIERMYAELDGLSQDEDKNKKLELLDRAAGYFRAAAAHLKIVG